jgi:large subunit ribosomal protein L31
MKEGLHPKYERVMVECACGNRFETRSTLTRIKLDICSNCHPFYTGQQKLVDTAGRVERFQKRFVKTEGKTVVRKPKASKAAAPKPSKAVRKILRNAPVAVKPKTEKAAKKNGK